MDTIINFLSEQQLPILIIVGIVIIASFFSGKVVKYLRLPSLIGFMIIGALLGPSLFNILNESIQNELGFITDIALGFVAVTIGLELSFSELRRQGRAIVIIIITESLFAFFLVTAAVYFLTSNLPLALIFGAIAPASAPAGTVAIIQEYRARGSLTRALYSVVGFDDGLGIIIFGFAAAVAKSLLATDVETTKFFAMILPPLKEIVFSIAIGAAGGILFLIPARKLAAGRDIFVLAFGAVFILAGVSHLLHLSLILTTMVFGMTVVNSRNSRIVKALQEELTNVMPLLFILFFTLAGANLHIAALPALGLLGLVYMAGRSGGLVGGAFLGATIGRAEPKIRKYLGMGILSQAGVAIGLALMVRGEFAGFGDAGTYIGNTVITTITATCIIFEIIGPILTKIGLTRAGEIEKTKNSVS
ncbi:MAG: cation:proton antiporter [Spirochaetales bacterium]|nr:cation:proton antiporter [Spirochaetales bacterium]